MSQPAHVEGVLLFLFRLGRPLLMPVGQGSLFGLVLSEVVVDPVPELVRQVLLFHPAAEVMGGTCTRWPGPACWRRRNARP